MKTKTMPLLAGIVTILVFLTFGCNFPQPETNKANIKSQPSQDDSSRAGEEIFQILNVPDIIAHPGDYFKVKFTPGAGGATNLEFGLKIDKLKETARRIPSFWIKHTSFEKISAYNFYVTDVRDNVVYMKCGVTKSQWEDSWIFGMVEVYEISGTISFNIPLRVTQQNGKNALTIEKVNVQNVNLDAWLLDLVPPIKSWIEGSIGSYSVNQTVELPYLDPNMLALKTVFTQNGYMFFSFQIGTGLFEQVKAMLAQYGIIEVDYRPQIRVLNGESVYPNNQTIDLGRVLYYQRAQLSLTIANVGWARMHILGNPKVVFSSVTNYVQATANTLPDFLDPGNTATLLLSLTTNSSNIGWQSGATFKITTDSVEESTFTNKITFYTGS